MRILIASDKFKGSLNSRQAGQAIAAGLKRARPDALVEVIPVADGGEGTLDAIVTALGGERRTAIVTGPDGQPVTAEYAILADGQTAVIEMAAAAGWTLVTAAERQPLDYTTYGVGELIRHCLDAGCRRLLIGLGGSATVDLGFGLAQALGARFLDAGGHEVKPIPINFDEIAAIDTGGLDARLTGLETIALCDVTLPLFTGVMTFAPQKGATTVDLNTLFHTLPRMAKLLEKVNRRSVVPVRGSGAAGGLGAGLLAFLQARLTPGAETILNYIDFKKRLAGVDLVITGEGRFDQTSLAGKTVSGILDATSKRGIATIAFVGSYEPKAARVSGLSAIHAITPPEMSEAQAITQSRQLLEDTVARVFNESPNLKNLITYL